MTYLLVTWTLFNVLHALYACVSVHIYTPQVIYSLITSHILYIYMIIYVYMIYVYFYTSMYMYTVYRYELEALQCCTVRV